MQGALAGGGQIDRVSRWRTLSARAMLAAVVLAAILLALAWAIATQDVRVVAAICVAVAAGITLVRAPGLVWIGIGAVLPFAAALKWGVISALDVALGAAIFLWFVDGVRRRTLTLRWIAPALAGLLYVGVLLLSALGARDLEQALAEVVKWGEFVAVLVIAPAMLQRRHVRWVVAGALVGASLQALLGVYQFVFQIGPEWFIILERYMRASGTFAQPNPFGGYLGLVLPVGLSLTIDAVAAVWRSPADAGGATRAHVLAWGWLLFVGAATSVIAAGLLASWSRGGWLGAAAAVVMVVILRSRRAAFVAAGATLVVLALALLGTLSVDVLPQALTVRVQDIPAYFGAGDVLNQEVDDDNFAVIERLAHWEAARRMFVQSPILGVGAGNYAAAYDAVNLPRWEEALGHAHNIYLNTLAETGIVGMFAFVLLWGTAAFWCMRRVAHMKAHANSGDVTDARDNFGIALGVGVIGVLVHLAVHSVVDNLFVQGIYLQIALWLALLAVQSNKMYAPGGRPDA